MLVLIAFAFCLSCALKETKKFEYGFLTESFGDLGEKANLDQRELGRLLDLPVDFYYDNSNVNKRSDKSWLGIAMKLPEITLLNTLTSKEIPTIEVESVFPNSPALLAGFKKGDQITKIDGKRLTKDPENRLSNFRKAILEQSPGSSVIFEILRKNLAIRISTTLQTRLKTTAPLTSHPDLETEHGATGSSLLHYILKKERLEDEFRGLFSAIRDTARLVNSPFIAKPKFNPFRLKEINYLLKYPFDAPFIAQGIVRNLHRSFGNKTTSLGSLLRLSMKNLDMEAASSSEKKPVEDLTDYLEQLTQALVSANEERKRAIEKLTADEIELLLKWGVTILKEQPKDKKEKSLQEEPHDSEIEQLHEEKLRFFNVILKLDLKRLLSAVLIVADALDINELLRLKGGEKDLIRLANGWVARKQNGITVIETSAGKILLGGKGRDIYRQDAVLIVDLGGDDLYLNRAGGSNLRFPFSVVIDFGGDDVYLSDEKYVQGSGLLGAGFLIDLAGDDRYTAANFAQGAGFLGVGALVDIAGYDEYRSDAFAQGAGAFGVGILAEGGGDDRYTAARFAQGFGFIRGLGVVVESGGADKYFAGGRYSDFREPDKAYGSLSQGFGLGSRPDETFIGASGGIGIIADQMGNDLYVGDYFAQGSSYWYALGILADESGHDKYISRRYSQGAGTHFSIGVLWDAKGDDQYLSTFGVAQGCGHDYSIGILLDNGGNDRYIGGVIAQGAGNDNGLGVLIDNGGQDEYHIKAMGRGRGNYHKDRGLPSFGIQFDTGGSLDYYSIKNRNNRLILKTEHGIFADTR